MTSKSTIHVRKPYDPPIRKPILFTKQTMAKQAFKDESDINTIMKRYERTGLLEHTRNSSPQYGDFSNVVDYQTAINQIMDAQRAFSELSAQVRRRFGNDPAEFLAFMDDPANADEARALGLLEALPPEPLPSEPKGAKAPSGGSAEGGTDTQTAPAKQAGA